MISRLLILTLIWVALWGDFSVANIITGIVIAIALSVLFPGIRHSTHRIRIIPAIGFALYMLKSITVASWDVILAVLAPNETRRHVEVITVSLHSKSPLIRAITANTISLTPGTVITSMNLDSATMDIHVLGKTDGDDFQNSIHAHEARVEAFIVEKL